jgi:hypothetical protein
LAANIIIQAEGDWRQAGINADRALANAANQAYLANQEARNSAGTTVEAGLAAAAQSYTNAINASEAADAGRTAVALTAYEADLWATTTDRLAATAAANPTPQNVYNLNVAHARSTYAAAEAAAVQSESAALAVAGANHDGALAAAEYQLATARNAAEALYADVVTPAAASSHTADAMADYTQQTADIAAEVAYRKQVAAEKIDYSALLREVKATYQAAVNMAYYQDALARAAAWRAYRGVDLLTSPGRL